MNLLEMEFDPTQESVRDEVKVAEPYDFLSTFFAHELRHRVDNVKEWMKEARDALEGKQVNSGWGNGWKFDGNAQMIKFTNVNDDEYTIPTPLLVEAFERYLMYLEARGFKPDPPGDD